MTRKDMVAFLREAAARGAPGTRNPADYTALLVTAQDALDAASELTAARSEVEALKEVGKPLPADLKKWAEDHEIASVTTWKTPEDEKPLWRVNWNFGTLAGDGPRETIIGPGRFPRIAPLPSALYPASKIPVK
jgi:hypothetical protein